MTPSHRGLDARFVLFVNRSTKISQQIAYDNRTCVCPKGHGLVSKTIFKTLPVLSLHMYAYHKVCLLYLIYHYFIFYFVLFVCHGYLTMLYTEHVRKILVCNCYNVLVSDKI